MKKLAGGQKWGQWRYRVWTVTGSIEETLFPYHSDLVYNTVHIFGTSSEGPTLTRGQSHAT